MRGRGAHGALLLTVLLVAAAGTARAAVVAAVSDSAHAGAAPRPARPATKALQSVRGDHVKIEGKLYSPQALFVMTRRDEAFGRDAILPHYLAAPSGTAFLPYRLRAEVVPAPPPAPRP